MPKNQTLIEDMISLGGNIMGNLLGTRHEMRAQAKQHMESVLRHLDIVSREEFDAMFAMLSKARLMQAELDARLKAVESHLKLSSTKPTVSTKKTRLPSVKKDKRRRARA